MEGIGPGERSAEGEGGYFVLSCDRGPKQAPGVGGWGHGSREVIPHDALIILADTSWGRVFKKKKKERKKCPLACQHCPFAWARAREPLKRPAKEFSNFPPGALPFLEAQYCAPPGHPRAKLLGHSPPLPPQPANRAPAFGR